MDVLLACISVCYIPEGIPALRGGAVHGFPPLTTKHCAISDAHWQRKNLFSLMESYWDY